ASCGDRRAFGRPGESLPSSAGSTRRPRNDDGSKGTVVMAGLLPATGELYYNGWTWDSLHHTAIRGVPVYDDANRMVKWIAWSIEVSGFINAGAGATSDNTMASLRRDLTNPGKTFRYNNKGFGALVVNDPSSGNVWDVNWGPKPTLFDFKPIGSRDTA